MNAILTLLWPIIASVSQFFGIRRDKSDFFSTRYTNVLKGLACIIVFMVHVPMARRNPMQDAIGSFAYVCVTFFFLVSAYGMLYSADHRQDYLRQFWRGRLLSLLVPALLLNIVFWLYGGIGLSEWSVQGLLFVNDYILVLLEWCLLFYLVKRAQRRWFPTNDKLSDALLAGGVFLSSIVFYWFPSDTLRSGLWSHERMGLVWGLLLYRNLASVRGFLERHQRVTLFILAPLALVLGVGYLKYKAVFFWGEYLLKVVLGVVLLALLFSATFGLKIGDNKVSRWLGSISYEVYLGHAILMNILNTLIPTSIPSGQFICLACTLMVILASLVHPIAKTIIDKTRNK